MPPITPTDETPPTDPPAETGSTALPSDLPPTPGSSSGPELSLATPPIPPPTEPSTSPAGDTPPIPPPSEPSAPAAASPDASASAAAPLAPLLLPNGEPLPTIGRIVHYVLPGGATVNAGQIRAATVVRVWGGPLGGVNLVVQHDPSDNQGLCSWATSVLWSADGEPNTWSYPPRL